MTKEETRGQSCGLVPTFAFLYKGGGLPFYIKEGICSGWGKENEQRNGKIILEVKKVDEKKE
ncbi:unnamed protein product [Camellia sinensis]